MGGFPCLSWERLASLQLTCCCRELSQMAPPICKKDQETSPSCAPRDELGGFWWLACGFCPMNLTELNPL